MAESNATGLFRAGINIYKRVKKETEDPTDRMRRAREQSGTVDRTNAGTGGTVFWIFGRVIRKSVTTDPPGETKGSKEKHLHRTLLFTQRHENHLNSQLTEEMIEKGGGGERKGRGSRAEEYRAYHTSRNKYTLYRKCNKQKTWYECDLTKSQARIDKLKSGAGKKNGQEDEE